MHSMNNDVVFSGPAHILLLKTGLASTDRQTCKSTSASLLASPQAARKKKRYIKLDLLALAPQDLASSFQNEYDGLGSIGSLAA
jgi:succinylglutamate desuccinylase